MVSEITERMLHYQLQHRLHSEITLPTETGDRAFAVGERVVFTRNNRALGVKNGQAGTLTAWGINNEDGIVLTVAADNGNRVEFDSPVYGHVDHGYALAYAYGLTRFAC